MDGKKRSIYLLWKLIKKAKDFELKQSEERNCYFFIKQIGDRKKKKERSFKDYLMVKLEWCDWPNSSLELVRCKKLEEVDGLFGQPSSVEDDDDKNIWWFFQCYHSPIRV